MFRILFIGLLLGYTVHLQQVNCQVLFKNETQKYLAKLPVKSLNPVGVFDVNGDLIDDIVVLNRGNKLMPIVSAGSFQSFQSVDTVSLPNFAWTMTAGDLNNDGKVEIVTAGEYIDVRISSLDNRQWSAKFLGGYMYAQGSNLVDLNNDGWLDYFVCDDNAHSKIYMNDKSGKLILTNLIDFSIGDQTDGSGNYGSEWVDVNGDLLQDLYIAKCRAGVDDPKDNRRINRLYINRGNGNFTEMADSFNIASGAQSWVGVFGDLDNDGDQDLFVANHYSPHELFENINGRYFRKVNTSNFISNFCLQAAIRDFDNDGFQDILMAGVDGPFFLRNKGNFTFDYVDNILGGSKATSFGIGDLNDDGFLDVYASQSEPINVLGFSPDDLFINAGNQNHFLKVSLIGRQSNRTAVGAKATIYGSFGQKCRVIKAGESYGIVNSHQLHFGLGQENDIDSLIVQWPSGTVDVFKDVSANQTLVIEEGNCLTTQENLTSDILFISNVDSFALPTTNTLTSFLWSTGESSQVISVDKPGIYSLSGRTNNGCLVYFKPILVESGCFDQNQESPFLVDSIQYICDAEVLDVNVIRAQTYLWSTGETTQSILVSQMGKYGCTITDDCGRTLSGDIQVIDGKAEVRIETDTVGIGQRATLISDSPATEWFLNLNQGPIYVGDTLITEPLTQTTTYFARSQVIIDENVLNIGPENFPSPPDDFGGNNTEGDIIFDVLQPIILKSVLVKTDKEGIRKVVIKQENNIVFEREMFIPSGTSRVLLDAVLPAGMNYSIFTDAATNLKSLGYKGPRLTRNLGNVSYPYSAQKVINLRGSKFGPIYYYYFYDWEVAYDLKYCTSDISIVEAVVDKNVGTKDNSSINVEIAPNPVLSSCILTFESDRPYFGEIIDINGRKLARYDRLKSGSMLDLSMIDSGLYYLVLIDAKGKNSVIKFVKI